MAWSGGDELVSVSWDHTIKIWELEMGGLKTELVANKVCANEYSIFTSLVKYFFPHKLLV